MNLVLAHGYLGFTRFLHIEYFRGVKQDLEKNFSAKILITKVDPDESVEKRGAQLRRQILVALGKTPAGNAEENRLAKTLDPSRKTHIIAHSMGGFDSRFMLSPANPDHLAAPIASLTTISTPHRGSPIADWFSGQLDEKRWWLLNWWVERQLRKVLTALGISLAGLQNLTTAGAASFNQKYDDHPQVRYFSVAGAGRASGRPTANLLYPAYKYINQKTSEANDGLVALSSAKWGEFDSQLWPADHMEEVGHDLDRLGKSGNFDHLAKYRELAARLQNI